MTPSEIRYSLRAAAKEMRQLAQDFDALAARAIELEFQRWQLETVFPQAVARWVAEIGADA